MRHRFASRPSLVLLLGVLCCAVAARVWGREAGQLPRAPGTGRQSTTVGALAAYPLFFHTRTVRVRGTVQDSADVLVLAEGSDARVVLAGAPTVGMAGDVSAEYDVTGTFLDVGRLTEGDPRLAGIDVARVSQARVGKAWPGVGELLILNASAISPGEPFPAPSVRALAVAPDRYGDATVTVTGRFRGRNLYGDQPDAPGRSRWDFVLQSADASVWVVGLRPRGRDFSLDVEARVDTGRWLEVSGVVRRERALVLLEATRLALAQPPTDPAPAEPVLRVPAVGPRPEVVFSAPTADETDVSPGSRVRIQFSRDLDPSSLKEQVRVGYLGAQSTERGEPQPPPLAFSTRYDEGGRALEIRFVEPLARFRTVKVELLEGIRATDGAPLEPWTLTFAVGG